MDTGFFQEWDTLVEQAILDIQENLASRTDLSQEKQESILPFMSKSIIQEICLERNWNKLCANFTCEKYRRPVAKVDEDICRSWFCSGECHESTKRYTKQAGEDHPSCRNIVKHLSILYPNIPFDHIRSLYALSRGPCTESEDSSLKQCVPGNSTKNTIGQAGRKAPPWSAKTTPAPKSLIVQTPSAHGRPVQHIPRPTDEQTSSSSDDEEEFSIFQSFPLLSILLDAWRTNLTVKYIMTGQAELIPSFNDLPHKSDVEYILEHIGAALARFSLSLSGDLVDEIPNVIASFDITRKYGFRELMGETNIVSDDREHIVWLSMALVIYFAIAKFRHHNESPRIIQVAETHTELTRDSLESLSKILLQQLTQD